MGVGVYESNFHGAGSTFIVDGPLAREEDYDDYKAELGEEALSYEYWAQDEYDDFNEYLTDTIGNALSQLGFSDASDRASFDSDFVGLGENPAVEVGWRSWETDFIIATAANRKMLPAVEEYGNPEEAMAETGLPAETIRNLVSQVVQDTQAYLRICLIENGFECRYRTSGYTTGRYTQPPKHEEELARLKASITDSVAKLNITFEKTVANMTGEKAEELFKSIHVEKIENIQVLVPFYNIEDKTVVCWNQDGELVCSIGVPDNIEEVLQNATEYDGIIPILRNEQTQEWFNTALKQHFGEPRFLLDVQEFGRATGEEEFTILYEDDGIPYEDNIPTSISPAPTM